MADPDPRSQAMDRSQSERRSLRVTTVTYNTIDVDDEEVSRYLDDPEEASLYLSHGEAPMGKEPTMTPTKSLRMPRLIYSDMEPRVVSTKNTITAKIVGEGSSTEATLFGIGVKNWKNSTTILWAMWFLGAVVGMLVVGGLVRRVWVWLSLLMLPLPILTILLLNTDLVYEILCGLDVYVVYILQLAQVIDGIYYCKFDIRWVFWCCYIPTIIASGLLDAYPAKWRSMFEKLWFGAAIAILVWWNILLVFKWRIFETPGVLGMLIHHISDQATLLIFFGRHLYCSFHHPNHFVMIKAEVLTGRRHLDAGGNVRIQNLHRTPEPKISK